VYSNASDTKKDAMPWFWTHFDHEGYSIWFCDYKCDSNFDMLFKVCNFVGGIEQGLDSLRKYVFGSLLIFGNEAEKKFDVSGVVLFRGHEVPQEFKEDPSVEAFSFRKIDINNEHDKNLVEDFWAWKGNFGGRSDFLDNGKVMK